MLTACDRLEHGFATFICHFPLYIHQPNSALVLVVATDRRVDIHNFKVPEEEALLWRSSSTRSGVVATPTHTYTVSCGNRRGRGRRAWHHPRKERKEQIVTKQPPACDLEARPSLSRHRRRRRQSPKCTERNMRMKQSTNEVDDRACQTSAEAVRRLHHRQWARHLSLISGASTKFNANSEEVETATRSLCQANQPRTSRVGVTCIV